jgi:hypothetical protein
MTWNEEYMSMRQGCTKVLRKITIVITWCITNILHMYKMPSIVKNRSRNGVEKKKTGSLIPSTPDGVF